jgi:hypothetical protein
MDPHRAMELSYRRTPRAGGPVARWLASLLCCAFAVGACTSSSTVGPSWSVPRGVFLPRMSPRPSPSGAVLIAVNAVTGTLAEDHGCIVLTKLALPENPGLLSPGMVLLPPWPSGSTGTRDPQGGVRIDIPGRRKPVQTGSRAELVGRLIASITDAEAAIDGSIPRRCQVGSYFRTQSAGPRV